jgi:hypothetical protein
MASGLALAIYFGLISLPLLPCIVIAAIGMPLGLAMFIFTMSNQLKSPGQLLDSSASYSKPVPLAPPTIPSLPVAQSLEDMCNDIGRTYYGKPFPKYEDIEVIPAEGGSLVKWISLPDDQKWRLFQEGSKGTGGRRAVADIQRLLDAGKPLSEPAIQKIMQSRLDTAGKVSQVHGAGHAQRCAALVKALEPLYTQIFQLPRLTEEELTTLQIAAMFHDSGRQGDGSDVWEEVSAQNAEKYLRQANFPEHLCIRAGNAIRGKNPDDPFSILLYDADGLEYQRVRGGEGFDANHLAASKLTLAENVSEDARNALSQQITEAEKKFLTQAHDFGIDYKKYTECAASLFSASILPPQSTPPAPVADGKALGLVTKFVDQAGHFAAKLNQSLPTEIAVLRDVKTRTVDWSAAAGKCRSLLQQLGQNPANENNADAIQLGGNVESILICCIAFAEGHVSAAKLQNFKSGLFSQTYTVGAKVFKPIDPTNPPSELDMERRYGISQFTRWAREMLPQQMNAFFQEQAARMGVQIPDLFVQARPGIIDGQIGIVMDMASGACLANIPPKDKRRIQDDPVFRRLETWLQLLDCFLGQYDRHSHNVFWDDHGRRILAIDNDISFSDPGLRFKSQFTDRHGSHPVTMEMLEYAQTVDLANKVPGQLYRSRSEGGRAVDGLAGAWNYCMPLVIDEDMRRFIEGMNVDEFRQFLDPTGLTSGQINAAVNRLTSMKRHITDGRTRVIDPAAWGSAPLPECRTDNTYFMWHTR